MRFLNEQDVLKSLTLDEVMQGVEKALATYESGDFFMPHRVHVDHGQKTLLYMPCAAQGALGTKYLTLFPENIAKDLPTLYGLMILNDYETGKPLCILDGKTLTALRTGAVGGLGIKHTTPDNVSSVGLIGTGVQGYFQLLYATHVRKFSTICIYDANTDKLPEFAAQLQPILHPDTKIKLCSSAEELLDNSEVIITTTTANTPVLPDNPALLKGKHYIGIGSYKPTMREFPEALCQVVDNFFVDVDLAKEESGDLAQPLASGALKDEQIRSFGKFLLHDKDFDKVKNSTTLLKSVGMALFDVTVAKTIYEKAEQNNIGYAVAL